MKHRPLIALASLLSLISLIAWTLMFFTGDKARPDSESHNVGALLEMSGKTANPRQTAAQASPSSAPGSAKENGTTDTVASFRTWYESYLSASPADRTEKVAAGVELAKARRAILKQLIKDDPRRALADAVPIVVRQQLPQSILSQIEGRVNTRAAVTVYQGVPAQGEPLPAPGKTITHRIAQTATEGAFNLHVYGRRAESVLNVPNAALNGIVIDREIAANQEPLRVLEVGEVPNPAKVAVTVCPVSGKTTLAAKDAALPITEAQQESVIETPEENIYLCGPFHATFVRAQLIQGEGSTGGPTPLTGILPSAPTPALGMCKVLYIPMTFQDQNNVPATESKCYEVMRDVADYYLKSSYGKLTTMTTVTPPVILPKNEAWYIQRDTSNGGDVDGLGLEMTHARDAARRMGFDYNDYDVTVLRMSGGARPAGGWGGGSTVWIYGDSVGVTAHEIGHAFGLAHANFWDTAGTSAIGPGANAEYGDSYDVMGGGGVPKDHYNAAAKVQIKWLPDNFVQNVTASGLYRIYAFDQPVLEPRNRYAMTITKDSQHTYWGEVRQNYNGDTTRPWADKGLILGWKYSSGGGSNIQLLDTTPGSPYGKDDAAIALGSTFGDTEAGIFLTTVGVSSTTPKYIDVVVNIGDFAGNHPPTMTLTSSADVVPTGATVTFTATASDADGDTLAYQWQHWGDTNIRLVSPNSPSITRTFSTAGTYVVSCTVSDMKGGAVTRTKLITVGNGGGKFTISGRIIAGGVGLAGVLVNANGLNPVVTDADGYYTVANLSANTYSVTPLLYGYSFGELFNNSITVGPNFAGADFEATALPSVAISSPDATATEGAADTATFRLTRNGDLSQPLTVNVNPAGGTATSGDYTLAPGLASGSGGFSTFTIPADSATLDVVVTPVNDTTVEGPETLTFSLGAGAGYLIASGGGSATITIEDNDTTLPKVSIVATTAFADEGLGTPGIFTISRTSTTTALTVNYSVSGTATSGSDFTALSGSVTMAIGVPSVTVQIAPVNDALVEPLETVKLTLTADPGYFISPTTGNATVYITDDDTNVVSVIASDPIAKEVDLSVPGAIADTGTFLITRTGDTTLPLTVYYSLAGTTTAGAVPAIHGVDYEALPGVVQIPAGATSASVTIIPRWDAIGETAEQVVLQLGAGPTDYKLGASTSATVTINDSDTSNAPYVEVIGLTSATEGGTAGKFRFSVKGTVAGTISVPFSIGGTAIVTTDYTVAMPASPTGSTFNPATGTGTLVMTGTGTNVLDVTINTVNNAVLEDIKTVTCTLTPGASFTSYGPTSSASIWLRDDDQPNVWVDAQVSTGGSDRVTEGSSTTPIKFYISRTGATTGALTVNFSLSGTATPGTDYTVTTGATLTFDNPTGTGVLTIPAGLQGADVPLSISTTNDVIFEGTETIVFHLTPGAYSRTPDATIYLDDNDTSTQKVAFATAGASGLESVTTVNVPVTLTTPASVAVTVDYVVDTGSRSSSSNTTSTSTLPYWVRVVRAGSSLSSYYSTDGVIWNQTGTTQTISMASTSFTAGLIATSGTTASTCVATIDNVTITGLDGGGAAGAATAVTIGTTTPVSSSSEASGVYTLTAGGTDLAQSGTTGDVGRYVYFPITNSANCTITARVSTITGGATTARGGVMIRESTSTTSRHMAMSGQRDGTARMIHRITTTAATVSTTLLRPYWVKLQRAGDIFSAYASPDGSTWTQTGANQTIAMSADLLAGLAVSARSDGNLSTAAFDNVTLNGGAPPTLAGRTVGYVNAQGSDSVAGGVYTVNGSGAQIGGTEDECHFVAAPVTGDFTLVARVVSQSGGAANAQAGVMARELYNYRARSAYIGLVANSMSEFIYRNSTVTNAFGTAVDHSLASGTMTFAIGEQTKNITFNVTNDTIPEPNEAITILLRNPNGAQLGTNTTFTYVINDDDTLPPLPYVGFASGTGSAIEATAGTQQIPVSLSVAAAGPVTVQYAVTGGTATAGADFITTSGTLTFAAGETVQSIPLTILDDSIIENSETVILTLSNPVNAALGTLSTHTFTITDDDLPVVSIVANDPDASEAGLDPGQFTISRTGPTTGSLAVTLARSGTATNGTDYTSISASTPFTFTIPAGAVSAVINIVPIQDTTNEGSETVILTVNASASAYVIGASSTGTVTIADDDRSTVTITATDPVASETPGNTGTFTVTRTAPTTGTLSVAFTVSGTATSGSDFTALVSPLTFAANEVSKTITVTPINDTLIEGDETVVVQLSAGSYTIGGNGYDTVTIQDNDIPPTAFITSPTASGALIASGNGLVVSASVADDGTPQPLSLIWTQASGPGTATFETPTLATSAVTFSADGVYVLRITVTDGQFTVSDQVTVVVGSAIAPADWIAQDMSPTTQQRGQSAKVGSSYVLTGMGAGYSATASDGAHIMSRQVTGDGSIVARITGLSGTAATPLAGVTIRDSLARSCNRAVLGYSAGALQFRTRTSVSANDTVVSQSGITLPVWIKLDRVSATNAITASYAPDNNGAPGTWAPVGIATTMTMANDITQMGLTATGNSSTAGQFCTATFDNVTLTPVPNGPALVTEDFGTGTPTASTFALNAGTYTIGGSGSMDGSGGFYGWQYYGDVMVTAKLASATSSALSAKSGIMIRESMDSTAGYIHVGRIPQGAFNGYIWRSLASGSGGGVPSFTGTVRWMRLIRQGNRVTAFHAADVSGAPGTWTQIGQPQTVIMSTPVLVGFAVDNSGGTAGVLNVCTFSNLSIVPLNKAPVVGIANVAAYPISPIALDGTVTDDAYPAPVSLTTVWSKVSGPGTVAFGNPTLTDTTLTLGQYGAYKLRLAADDGSAQSFKDMTLTGYTSPFEAWQGQNWPATGGPADPDAAPMADSDLDGQWNLVEYATGTAPQVKGMSPLVLDQETVSSQKYLRLTVPKNPVATDVTYEVQATGNLGDTNSWSSSGLVIEVNTGTSLRVRDNVPVSNGGRRFMRVKIAQP